MMDENTLIQNDGHVTLLRSLVAAGASIEQVPSMVKLVCANDAWRERIIAASGEKVCFDNFVTFVETPPLEGLGIQFDVLWSLCKEDTEAKAAIEQALDNSKKQGKRNDLLYDVQEVKTKKAPTGNSSLATLRRLRKDFPDLHKRVLAGELAPNTAAVEAGFRRPSVRVSLDNMQSTANTLASRLDRSQLAELMDCLTELWAAGRK